MHEAQIIVLLFAAVGVLAVVAHKITLPYPIVLGIKKQGEKEHQSIALDPHDPFIDV